MKTKQSSENLLDAYSQAVTGVVEKLQDSVVTVAQIVNGQVGGIGSGIQITPDGFIVTNNHVVGGNKQIVVSSFEGEPRKVRVIGTDPFTDLALLKDEESTGSYAAIADSDSLKVGQLVIGIGSPLGLHRSVATGIISALGRSLPISQGIIIEDIIQTTLGLNPGNSGGPLADSHGNVIGINTAIIAAANGISLSVPANTVNWVIGELISHGNVRRVKLGLLLQTFALSKQKQSQLAIEQPRCIVVHGVEANSRAEKAGIKSGDIILRIGDTKVKDIRDIQVALRGLESIAEIEVTALRKGKTLSLYV